MILIDFLFPPVCHLCGNEVPPGEYLCGYCLSQLPRTLYHRNPDNPMALRFAGKFPFGRATGHFFYAPKSPLATIVQDLKYRHFPSIGRMLGQVMARELTGTGFFSDIDALVPVPLHFFKKARRGYNQTELIAKGISEITGIRVENCLKASRPHRTQTSLSHEERTKNLNDVFRLSHSPHADAHLLIIDDVCTTGATLTAAARAILRTSPSQRISMLTAGITF